MLTKNLQLSTNFSIPAVDYAGQGNAILGIRDAGKTYTAMKAAEQLLDAQIPIIVYDPVGVWKNLKIGTGKNKGYPIVVAGGIGSDIILNVHNAVDIVRAAMKENVSLVIDLYSPELINKSTWIRIVQETVDLLMYENKECGLRHIFIEESAEFVPQRLQPQHAKVYASLERLARMGRNARLGYTLINQRAEEVNKAILEISALSLLHKQVGKNSIASVQKWLELMQVENFKDITKSLPTLGQGECWVIGVRKQPELIQISPRKTFHPDPKKHVTDANVGEIKKVDVSSFVVKLNAQLKTPTKTTESSLSKKEANELEKKNLRIEELSKRVEGWRDDYNNLEDRYELLQKERDNLLKRLKNYDKQFAAIRKIVSVDEAAQEIQPVRIALPNSLTKHNQEFADKVYHLANNSTKDSKNDTKLHNFGNPSKTLAKCPLAIIRFLASFPDRSFTKAQVGIATGYSPGSGGFNNALSELNIKALIVKEGTRLRVSSLQDAAQYIGNYEPLTYSIHTFKDKLGKCEREIYQVLLDNPHKEFIREELADATPSRYAATSGGFNNAISRLNILELIERGRGTVRLNPELLELIS